MAVILEPKLGRSVWLLLFLLVLVVLSGCANETESSNTNTADVHADVVSQLEALQARVTQLEDREAIRKLAFSYGYYMDNGMTDQVVTLLSPQTEFCEITGYGRYDGLEGCKKIWEQIIGPALQGEDGGLRFGRLIKHYLVKDVVTIDPSGTRAQGRFDYIGYSGVLGRPDRTSQQLGIYRLGFEKSAGIWRINRFQLSFDAVNFNDRDWAAAPEVRCPRASAPPPDGAPSVSHSFPEHAVAPFDYPNPVTGETPASYINPTRYWVGNWPGEFGGECGKRWQVQRADS